MGERLSATAHVKTVYGDPIAVGEKTVVPVARVRYAFGGGGGARGDAEAPSGGGGGKVSTSPCGALEITSDQTRFVPFVSPKTMGITFAAGIALGALLASLAMTKRIEIVKPNRHREA